MALKTPPALRATGSGRKEVYTCTATRRASTAAVHVTPSGRPTRWPSADAAYKSCRVRVGFRPGVLRPALRPSAAAICRPLTTAGLHFTTSRAARTRRGWRPLNGCGAASRRLAPRAFRRRHRPAANAARARSDCRGFRNKVGKK